jgi:DUF4097 and DUF4098 domain-containing protein YvlB
MTIAAPLLVLAATQASAQGFYRRAKTEARELYQGRNRGAEQSDTASRRMRIGRNGQVTIQNISGDITVTAGSGDEMTMEAVKRTRGDRSQLGRVDIVIDERPGRVDIRTEHRTSFRSDNVSVDYTVVVPDGASVDLKSISGNVRVTGARGSVRVQSISGNVETNNAPRVEFARTVSGNVDLAGVSQDGDLSAQSISGYVHATGLKARSIDVNSVSGEIALRSASCERLNARSVSGGFEYTGTLARNGRYEVNSHSGDVRFVLGGNTGFELNAGSFSGSVRSDYGAISDRLRGRGRGPRNESVQSAVGDGSARLDLHTFSGNITIARQ